MAAAIAILVATGPGVGRLGASGPGATGRAPVGRVVFTQTPADGGDRAGGSGAARNPGPALVIGSRIVGFDPAKPEDGVANLTAGFAAAGKPDVSFDGRRILFVGKRRASDGLSVWEMTVAGDGVRQITKPGLDCTEAVYLSTIYTMGAEEPVYQIAFCARGEDGVGQLLTCRMDGSRVRRITFNPYGATDPKILSDGRLLYSSGRGPAGGSSLFTVNTDGTDVFPFAATHEGAAIRGTPCETADGWVVYVKAALDTTDGGGSLVAVSRKRSLHTRRVVAADADGAYVTPSPTADGNLLVSYRGKDDGTYGVHVLDPRRGTRIALVFDTREHHEVDAAVIAPSPEPAGRSSVVDDRVEYGFLYCIDAYLSDTDRAKAIRRGQIKGLRIIGAKPPGSASAGRSGMMATPADGSTRLREEVLGEVRVESDGSFYVALPARMPLRLETLGEDGTVLQAMRSWIWVMPKEGRGCIGCHEDRELTPPNRFAQAVRKEPQEIGVKLPRKSTSPHERAPGQRYGGDDQ